MKKFVFAVCLFFLPVLLLVINYILLSINNEQSGDLGKMTKIFFEKGYHDRFNVTPDSVMVEDIEVSVLPDSIVIMCFGDSFSNRRPYCFLQPVAEYFGVPIANVLYNLDLAPEEAALGFIINAPQLKLPKVMIVECVERSCIPRLFWLDSTNPPSLKDLQKGKKHSTSTPRKPFDKELISYYKYRTGFINNNITITNLDQQCFSARGGEDILYSYYEDTVHYTEEYIAGTIDKLNLLHRIASDRNVTLIYMLAPNKSTLYAPYTTAKKRFFSILDTNSPFDTIPYVFNPLHTLRSLMKKGAKDIYYADDTHWTPATAKNVGEELTSFIMKQLTTNSTND